MDNIIHIWLGFKGNFEVWHFENSLKVIYIRLSGKMWFVAWRWAAFCWNSMLKNIFIIDMSGSLIYVSNVFFADA